jgi:hypothetical protein
VISRNAIEGYHEFGKTVALRRKIILQEPIEEPVKTRKGVLQ